MVEIRKNRITDEFENILMEVFERTHKCPWYKTLFKKKPYKQFSYIQEIDGIGTGTTVRCNICGETCDITNYSNW